MNLRLLLLSGVALGLGVILLLDRQETPPLPQQDAADVAETSPPALPEAPQEGQDAMLNPLENIEAESFSAVMDRPLFNPGRAPRPEDAPPEPPPVQEAPPEMPASAPGPRAEDFTLVAISAGPSGRVAALRLMATGEVLYLREGQPVQSWSVLSVGDRSVVIGTPQDSVTLTLFDSEPAGGDEPSGVDSAAEEDATRYEQFPEVMPPEDPLGEPIYREDTMQ
jgi:hypothetical protein